MTKLVVSIHDPESTAMSIRDGGIANYSRRGAIALDREFLPLV